jgi:predicted transposase/invertase (TIGR01784 family)
MKDFLTERSKEVYDMVSFKWDADMAKEVWQEEAMQKGMQQGIEQGLEKGLEKTALEMLRDKVDMNSIAKYTKLSLEKLNELGRLHGLL